MLQQIVGRCPAPFPRGEGLTAGTADDGATLRGRSQSLQVGWQKIPAGVRETPLLAEVNPTELDKGEVSRIWYSSSHTLASLLEFKTLGSLHKS